MPVISINLVILLILVGWNQDSKVIARSRLDGRIQFRSKQGGQWVEHPDTPGVVIRNVDDLVAACRVKEGIKDPGQLSAILAKEFRVDKIDWQTQMVVAIDLGRAEVSLETGPLKDHGWNLVLHYVLNYHLGGEPPPRVFWGEMMLVERIDREIRFRRTFTTSGRSHK